MTKHGYIAFDLDGTLAEYGGWQGPEHIGAPVPKMIERWKQHRAEGHECRIVTARVSGPEKFAVRYAIRQWCREHLGEEPVVQCEKDYGMVILYDDRARQVIPNTGIVVGE